LCSFIKFLLNVKFFHDQCLLVFITLYTQSDLVHISEIVVHKCVSLLDINCKEYL